MARKPMKMDAEDQIDGGKDEALTNPKKGSKKPAKKAAKKAVKKASRRK